MSVPFRPFGIRATFVFAAGTALIGCGGSATTDVGPTIPQVAGNYSITESVTAATCSPNQLPAGGTVILIAFSQTFDVIIQQTGSALKLYEVGFPDEAERGTVDAAGRISLSFHVVFQEEPREGNRVFFDDLTGQRDLQFQESAGRITGTSAYVNVFHENAISTPVFTTCSRQGNSTSLVRKPS